ncbi:hypothetical protein K437DRAFT_45033 [Tilletiaria anomala UBC 951]|uniref:Uncharacterized protein n=1 Tax=Tilletiaria anomala (strain ATCC 24038 / CBS 436.72 / UBC 951) TaxID=1037660 RepID=A0A066WMX8_TILAU|nr:uncharacterized protein K437DRAFT_45033 [Tilletiaria anomala UBC 951]KDN51990.1 hypothetical protein K437DRAFT_45033 [Tilletiaria anomala UBC 951]
MRRAAEALCKDRDKGQIHSSLSSVGEGPTPWQRCTQGHVSFRPSQHCAHTFWRGRVADFPPHLQLTVTVQLMRCSHGASQLMQALMRFGLGALMSPMSTTVSTSNTCSCAVLSARWATPEYHHRGQRLIPTISCCRLPVRGWLYLAHPPSSLTATGQSH